MVPLAGMETGAVEIAEQALWWKKREHYGPAGEESKSMPGRYLYVPVRDIPVVQLGLMKIPASGGSCPRANLDERRAVI